MGFELPIQPRSSGFLRSNAQKIGACVRSVAVEIMAIALVAIAMVAIAAVTIALVTISMATVARFEWPTQMHRPIFSIRDLKSKPGM